MSKAAKNLATPTFRSTDSQRLWQIARDRAEIDRRVRNIGLLPVLKILDPCGRLEGAVYCLRRRRKGYHRWDARPLRVDLATGTWQDSIGPACGLGFSSLFEIIHPDMPNHELAMDWCRSILADAASNPELVAHLNALATERIEAAAKAGGLIHGANRSSAVEARARALLLAVASAGPDALDLAVEAMHHFNELKCRPPLKKTELEAAIKTAASAVLEQQRARGPE